MIFNLISSSVPNGIREARDKKIYNTENNSLVSKYSFTCNIKIQQVFYSYKHFANKFKFAFCKKMIPNLRVLMFRVQNYMFGYMYPFPVEWNAQYTKLQVSQNAKRSTYLWIFVYLYQLLACICCLFNCIYFTKIQPDPEFKRLQLLTSFFCGFFGGYVSLVVLNGCRNPNLYLSFVARVFRLEKLCAVALRSVNIRIQKTENSVGDNFTLLMTPPCCLAPAFIVLIAVGANLDFSYWILKEFVLTEPAHRTISEIILSLFCRIVLIAPIIFEAARSILFFLLVCLCLSDSIVFVVKHIGSQMNPSLCNNLYTQIIIIWKPVKDLLELTMYVALNSAFWVIVFAVWLNIKGIRQIELSMRLLFLLGGALCLLGTCFALVRTEWIANRLKFIVFKNRHTAWKSWKRMKTKDSKLFWKESEAVCVINIMYGPLVRIRTGFIMEYLHLLTLRSCEAVLILDVK